MFKQRHRYCFRWKFRTFSQYLIDLDNSNLSCKWYSFSQSLRNSVCPHWIQFPFLLFCRFLRSLTKNGFYSDDVIDIIFIEILPFTKCYHSKKKHKQHFVHNRVLSATSIAQHNKYTHGFEYTKQFIGENKLRKTKCTK